MKKITLIILLFLFSLRTFAQSNLIGCYPLDNTANDFSGNNYNGTAYNLTSTSDRFSNPNHAYHFSGANSGIIINDSAFLLNNYTYSLWCRVPSLPFAGLYYSLISIGGNIADQALLIGNNSGPNHFGFGFGSWDSIPSDHSCWPGIIPNLNQWYHIVVTRDNDSLQLFIDDTLVCTHSTGNNAGYMGVPHSFSIGTRIDTLSQNFIGDIDDVKIIDRVLTAAEILLLDNTCNLFTGIENTVSTENLISLFPNPASDEIKIENAELKIKEIEIYSSLGEKVFSQQQTTNNKQQTVDVSQHLPGIYFITITDQAGSKVTRKVVKM